jgi:hypothetical protein
MYRLTAFGSQNLPLRRPTEYQGVGSIPAVLTPLVSGGLYDSHGSNRQPLQGASIGYTGTLAQGPDGFTTPALFEAEDAALRLLAGTEAKLYRYWETGATTQWTYARCVAVDATRSPVDHQWLDFNFSFVQKQFCWNGVGHSYSFYDIGALIDVTTLPRTGVLAAGAGATTLTGVNNSGNLNQHLMIITVTAKGGAVTAFDLTNSTTGHVIGWDGTLADGHALIIDTNDLSVENDGTGEYSLFAYAATLENWFELAPGNNSITATVTGGPATVEFVFYAAHA